MVQKNLDSIFHMAPLMPQDGIQLLSRVPLTREHGLEGGEGIFVGNRHGAIAGGLELDLFAISLDTSTRLTILTAAIRHPPACHHPATRQRQHPLRLRTGGGVVPYYDIEFLLICLSVVGFQNLVLCARRAVSAWHKEAFVIPFSMREVAYDACALSNTVGLVYVTHLLR